MKSQTPRILILENPATETQSIEAELRRSKFNCECRRMRTLGDFQAALIDFTPDVILAGDLSQQFTAVDALQAVSERGLKIPFILVTGTSMERATLECLRAGADDYVLKSNLSRLPGAIRNAIAKRLAATETRLAEQVLLRSEENYRVIVEDTVEKREGDLLHALEALQESHGVLQASQQQLIQLARMDSVARLAAGVAHEVKNPLTVMVLGVEYLRKHLPAGAGDAAQVLNGMDTAVKRANHVIQGMLDFSSPSIIRREQAQLNPVLDGVLALLDRDLTQRGIVIVRRFGENLPRLALDIRRMEQVFLNVFQNAIEAMDHGGTLTVTTGVGRLGEMTRSDADSGSNIGDEAIIAVEIEDTGPGIAEALLTKVFDPFFTTKPTGQGTGLGLTVTKRIVDMHGGLIRIRNRDEGGTHVGLLFPMEKIV